MTTHSTIEIVDKDQEHVSAKYLLHAFSDGHAVNFIHAMLSLPGWIARQKHSWLVKIAKDRNDESFFENIDLYNLWTLDWAGDVTAALVGIKPLWWVPWNYKDSPPYYKNSDFTVIVSSEWTIEGDISNADGKPVSYDFSDLSLDERIISLNDKIKALGKDDLILKNDGLMTIPAYSLWLVEIWDMYNE